MLITLYNVADGDNVINKNLGVGYDVEINLRNDVDVMKPNITLRDINDVDYENFNYAYIGVLGRYYFIDKLARVNARDSWLYLSCDVLETHKTEILASKARLKRNIKTGDFYDGSIDKSLKTSVMNYNSDVTLEKNVTYILTTVGAN